MNENNPLVKREDAAVEYWRQRAEKVEGELKRNYSLLGRALTCLPSGKLQDEIYEAVYGGDEIDED